MANETKVRVAGREMDAEIAERVMGAIWRPADEVDRHVCRMRGYPDLGYRDTTLVLGATVFAWCVDANIFISNDGALRDNLPLYSTSDPAALEVLKKIAGTTIPNEVNGDPLFSVDVQIMMTGQLTSVWVFVMDYGSGEVLFTFEAADTLALSTCRAALTYCDWRDAR